MGRIKYNRKKMKTMYNILMMTKTFDKWFSNKFSWFFTNGHKYISECELKQAKNLLFIKENEH